jgi:tungstate transport system substrate-binding protein
MKGEFLVTLIFFCSALLAFSLPGQGEIARQEESSKKDSSEIHVRLRIATTTSLYDTGLWDYLEPAFEAECGCELDVLSTGTGIALEYGRRGDVDAVCVHAKGEEERFVAEGYGARRVPFAYNYFLIVGPRGDPAGLCGAEPLEAFRKLREGNATFVSRGDGSGTHLKEQDLWKLAGFADYEALLKAGEWYIESGRGMGPTLLLANEKNAYTLSDAGTYLSYKGKLELVPLVEQGGELLNVYSVIPCNPAKNPGVNREGAEKLVEFLTRAKTQKLIGDFRKQEFGKSLFIPCAGREPPGH